MNKFLLLLIALCLGLSSANAQKVYPTYSLKDIQFINADSLRVADSLGYNAKPRWRIQTSPRMNDTVTVVALVTVPPKMITYTAGGRTLAVVDTGVLGTQPWSGVLVRLYSDSATADADGFFNIERGDIVKMVGIIQEFPANEMNSLTQFAPIPGLPFQILSSLNPLPAPAYKSIADFNVGPNPGGTIKFSTGEAFESKEVVFTNLTVGPAVNTSRGTFTITDEFGNTLSTYDWSYHFSLGHGGTEPIAGDPAYKVPVPGLKIDTIKGYISTSSGTEANRGYRICPIFVGDIKYGKIAPGVITHRRYPVIVAKDSSPLITAKAYKQVTGVVSGANLSTVKLVFSVNNGAWQEVTMTATQPAVDSLYQGRIPVQAAGSTVRYFVKATDVDTQVTTLANSGSLTQYDTSKGFFFYKSLDRTIQKVLTIRDVQTTIYINGRSPYVGAVDSVGGIVTADTASLRLSPLSSAGPSVFYIQSGNAPFSGLWAVGPDSIMTPLKLGDSVVVTGTIGENFDVTRIAGITSARIVSRNNTLPTPVKLKTEIFGPGASNGNLAAEPYEGMLVKFDSLTVSDVIPVYSEPTEYEVINSTGPTIVRRDGRNTYSNVLGDTISGLKILNVGNKIASLTGIIYFSNGRYKVTPRTNADYVGVVLGVRREFGIPKNFNLAQNFPNPFNPVTTIRYSIPNNARVSLKIYNLLGQEAATLVNFDQSAGTYSVSFDAGSLSSGVYLYRIVAGEYSQVKKMLLLK
jgi:hypothetical protein